MSQSIRLGTSLVVPSLVASLMASLAACGGTVVFDPEDDTAPEAETSETDPNDDSTSATGAGGAGGSGPLVCELVQGPLSLVPAADNPSGCRGTMSCEVYFGHGQHLVCPVFTKTPPNVACDIWDCICTPYPEDGFVASFATGEVVDARVPGMTCRYTIEPGT